MIKNNFNELMAQKKLKITRVSNDTGISRPTLTTLTRDGGKGIQYDTLNTLCNYFNITPGEFFDYIPYEFTIRIIDSENEENDVFNNDILSFNIKNYELFINVLNTKGSVIHTFSLYCVLAHKQVELLSTNKENLVSTEKTDKKIKATFLIDTKTDDEETFLTFLKNNFTVQWRFYILEYIENEISYYGKKNFYEFSIENDLKSLI